MVYAFDSKLPDKKSVIFALTHIYGINKSTSTLICKKLGFSKNFKIINLSIDQTNKLLKMLDFLDLSLGINLKKLKQLKLNKLVFIKSYRGLRKISGLPIRGQRTHTNSRTARKRLL
jgi:small subunit ribosomal protein S13